MPAYPHCTLLSDVAPLSGSDNKHCHYQRAHIGYTLDTNGDTWYPRGGPDPASGDWHQGRGEEVLRNRRIAISVSEPLLRALTVTAQRNGLTVSAQAGLCLRQAMARTMGAEARKRQSALVDHVVGMVADGDHAAVNAEIDEEGEEGDEVPF